MTVADILDNAAALIERDGWVQHTWRGCRGQRCAEGAIIDAQVGTLPGRGEPRGNPFDFFEGQLPPPPEGRRAIPFWNDAPERTQAEVVAKLREVAAKAREVLP